MTPQKIQRKIERIQGRIAALEQEVAALQAVAQEVQKNPPIRIPKEDLPSAIAPKYTTIYFNVATIVRTDKDLIWDTHESRDGNVAYTGTYFPCVCPHCKSRLSFKVQGRRRCYRCGREFHLVWSGEKIAVTYLHGVNGIERIPGEIIPEESLDRATDPSAVYPYVILDHRRTVLPVTPALGVKPPDFGL